MFSPFLTKFKHAIILFSFLGLSPASASVLLISGDHTVEVMPTANWTVHSITKNGRDICSPTQSAQGSVLKIDNIWAGSKHGNETLIDAAVFVDGIEKPLSDGLTYYGSTIEITRSSILAEAYQLTSTMTITPDWSTEHITFRGLDASKQCNPFYGFLGSRANRLTEYAAFDIAGSVLYTGTNDKNDNTSVIFGDAPAVAQYDSLEKDGILSVVTRTGGVKFVSFVCDRPVDNKLYFNFSGAAGPAYPANFFEFEQSLYFFEAEPDYWQQTAASLIHTPEPATLLLLALGGLALLRPADHSRSRRL